MRTLLTVVLLIAVAACGGDSSSEDAGADADNESTAPTTTVESAADPLPPLVSVPATDYTANHVNPPVSFATSPSTGGDHYQFWQNCGFYTAEAIEGAATHTMEHGAVWITYNPSSVSDEDLDLLESLSAGNGKLLISAYDHDDTIVLSAWGVQQRGVSAPSTAAGSAAIDSFISDWQDNPQLIEAGVRCNGSVGIPPEDVRSFEDGQQVPEAFG